MRFVKGLVVWAMLLAIAVKCAPAQTSAAQELKALLHEFMDAAGRGDRAVFDKFFAGDVIYTRATGVVITKADIMASLAKTSTTGTTQEKTTYSAEDITVHEYGDTVIVAFRLEGRTEAADGKVVTAHYRNTGTFLRRGGRWQAVAWQATRINEDGASR